MLLSVFENNYFLLAVSWAIVNSLWQGALCWIVFKIIVINGKLSALLRHHLSLLFLNLIFAWFIYTTVNGYTVLNDPGFIKNNLLSIELSQLTQQFSNIFTLIAVTYLLVVLLNSIRLATKFGTVFSVRNSGLMKTAFEYRLFVANTSLHMGINRKVELWLSEKIDVPCVTGFFKPMILLPFTFFNDLNTEQAEAIILHELAHIKRNDYIVNFYQTLIDIVLFFNPFAIILSKAARKERENCCDDWVMNYKYNKQAYASALLQLEKNRQAGLQLLPAATGDKGKLLQRIKRLFLESPQTEINSRQKLKLVLISISILLALLFCMPQIYKKSQDSYAAKTILPKYLKNKNLLTYNPELVKEKVIINNPVHNKQSVSNEVTKESASIAEVKIKKEVEYSVALINEELLSAKKELENLTVELIEKEVAQTDYLVKIEVEQSGSKSKTAYLFEYDKNENGNFAIKPLIILNRNKLKVVLSDTLKKLSAKKVSVKKKRITS